MTMAVTAVEPAVVAIIFFPVPVIAVPVALTVLPAVVVVSVAMSRRTTGAMLGLEPEPGRSSLCRISLRGLPAIQGSPLRRRGGISSRRSVLIPLGVSSGQAPLFRVD